MRRCWCGNDELSFYSDRYRKCEKCGTLVSVESFYYDPDNIDDSSDYYGKDYWEKNMENTAGKNDLNGLIDMYLPERAAYWISTVYAYLLPGKGKIADVGCGLGQFSYLARLSGFEQKAFDLSPAICAYVKDALSIDIKCGQFTSASAEYDVIAAFDVLEHFSDPDDFAVKASEGLKEDGFLIIQTPCYDPDLTYEEMLVQKPRFKMLLEEKGHLYLFSRKSVKHFLEKYGFKSIVFKRAFFGDDYDMFLVASKGELKEHSYEEIDAALNNVHCGRLMKALITSSKELRIRTEDYLKCDNDRTERGKQVLELTKQLRESESDRAARLKQIKTLSEQLKESEADRTKRFDQINSLSLQLKQSEADRAVRLEQVNLLIKRLRESEADRAARLEQINSLARQLKESEADRAARLEQINTLTKQLKESEADRAARLEQINTLTEMLNTRGKE